MTNSSSENEKGVGKTSMLLRFTQPEEEWTEIGIPTIGVDFSQKPLKLNSGKTVKIIAWDTAGQERFRTLTASYFRGAHGIILVYDVSKTESFELNSWIEEIDLYSNEKVQIMLVGNKIDLEKKIPTEKGLQFARENNMMFIETSAKTTEGIQQAFQELSQKIIDIGAVETYENIPLLTNTTNKERDEEDSCCN